MKLPQIIALYIGAVLGSGILILPGVASEVAGPASLLAWGFMAIMVLPMALTIGLLSAAFTNVGGVFHFAALAFSPRLGSLIGWRFSMAVVVGAPVLALAGAGYLCAALGLGDSFRLIIAIAVLLVGLAANYFGMEFTGRLQIAVVSVTLLVLIAAIGGGVGFSTAILFWCFIGWEAVSNFSAEYAEPKRDAIRGTIVAAVVIGIAFSKWTIAYPLIITAMWFLYAKSGGRVRRSERGPAL